MNMSCHAASMRGHQTGMSLFPALMFLLVIFPQLVLVPMKWLS